MELFDTDKLDLMKQYIDIDDTMKYIEYEIMQRAYRDIMIARSFLELYFG